MLNLLLLLSVWVLGSEAQLHQFGMVFFGECVNPSANEKVCTAKAQSQTTQAYIDPDTGVDFALETQKYGPVAVATFEMVRNQGKRGWTATGNITFGEYQSQETRIDVGYDYYDEIFTRDPENEFYYITTAFVNITGGTGAYANAFGLISFNAEGANNGDWNPYIFANVLIPQ